MTRRSLLFFIIFFPLFPGLSSAASNGIQGKVIYRGESMSGVYVEAFHSGKPDAEAVSSTNTGTDGGFRLSIGPGSYRITAKKRPEGPGSGGMLFGSAGPIKVGSGTGPLQIPDISLRDMGAGEGEAGAIAVSGSTHGPDGPLSGAYVYFYTAGTSRGPGYLARVRSGDMGNFKAGLSPGVYTVTVRFGSAGEGMGSVNIGDLVGDYTGNPLQVNDDTVDIGRIDLHEVDPDAWRQRQWSGAKGEYRISGLVVKEDRSPMRGAYVFLYDDRRMVGKPVSISAPTATDGRYSVTISRPGIFYLGARTRYGGPVEPGEFMGSWDEKGPKPVTLDENKTSAMCNIVVREVW